MVRAICAAGWAFCLSSGAFGQASPVVRPFEVASIRLHQTPLTRMEVRSSGPNFIAEGEMLAGLISYAYHLRNFQLIRGAEMLAMGNDAYDIKAKAEGDGHPSTAEFQQMLQLLLAGRFKLVVHREKREMPVYALVVGKSGPKLKASAPDAGEMGHLSLAGRNYVVTTPKAPMGRVVDAIENSFLDRPVIDRTGLTGIYDLKLVYTPDTRANRAAPDPGDLSIFTAVQDQLGFKLEPGKETVEVLVVDHVQKPGAN